MVTDIIIVLRSTLSNAKDVEPSDDMYMYLTLAVIEGELERIVVSFEKHDDLNSGLRDILRKSLRPRFLKQHDCHRFNE